MPSALVDNDFFLDFDEPVDAIDSEGNPLTQEQYKFFNKSKCIDEFGALFLVYRASNRDYDTFDMERLGTGAGSIFGKGIYFSADPESVKIYGSNIKKFYLNLQAPFRYEAVDCEEDVIYNVDNFINVLKHNNYPVTDDLRNELEQELLENDGGLDTLIELTCGAEKATEFFKNCGYDGIMNLDVLDFVAYEPSQVKLQLNKNPSTAASFAA